MILKINQEIISLSKKFQHLCKVPYYAHSKGCPNYGKKEGCPPGLPLMDKIFDFEKNLYLIYTLFPIGKFAERMKSNHPKWSKHPRQWDNSRRWQGTARKEHRNELENFLEKYPKYEYTKMPEAYGVNVTRLMEKVGIELNWGWPPEHNLENISYLISIGEMKR